MWITFLLQNIFLFKIHILEIAQNNINSQISILQATATPAPTAALGRTSLANNESILTRTVDASIKIFLQLIFAILAYGIFLSDPIGSSR